MNWKLLLIALTCAIVGISARPADETKPIEITQPPTTATAAATTKEEKPTTTTKTTTEASQPMTTIRYLQTMMPTKLTNSKLKYANNYANLITKYTLSNNKHNNRNLSSDNSNMYVNLHGIVVGSSLPSVKPSETTSNSSSRPIVFIDADVTTTQKATTKREYPLKLNVVNSWPSYISHDDDLISTSAPRKPVIHKILSKWSDDPQDVFLGGNGNTNNKKNVNPVFSNYPVFSTKHPKPNPMLDVDDLKNNLLQNVLIPELITSSSFNGFNQIGHDVLLNPLPPTTATTFTSTKTNKPYKNNCKTTRIRIGNKVLNQVESKENCIDELELHIDNNFKNHAIGQNNNNDGYEDYPFGVNDKFEDSLAVNPDSDEKSPNHVISDDIPQVVNSIKDIKTPAKKGDKNKAKGKKKKRPSSASANQIEYEDEDEMGIGFSTMLPSGMSPDYSDSNKPNKPRPMKMKKPKQPKPKPNSMKMPSLMAGNTGMGGGIPAISQMLPSSTLPSLPDYPDPDIDPMLPDDPNEIPMLPDDSDIPNEIPMSNHPHPIKTKKPKRPKHKPKPTHMKMPGLIAGMGGGGCDDCGDDSGSMMMTMLTMMAVFNPLNFGIWGFVFAPMVAVLLGGVAYGMYHVSAHPPPVKLISHGGGWSDPWPKPQQQEILVKNKIIHGPIPIKIFHKHSPIPTHPPQPPQIIYAEPMHMYGPPSMAYGPPMQYHETKKSKITLKPPKKHFAEPPTTDDYYLPPPDEIYKRKINSNTRLRVKKRPRLTTKKWFNLL